MLGFLAIWGVENFGGVPDSRAAKASGTVGVSTTTFGDVRCSAFEHASFRAFEHSNNCTFERPSTRAFERSSVRTFEHSSVRVFESSSVRESEHWNQIERALNNLKSNLTTTGVRCKLIRFVFVFVLIRIQRKPLKILMRRHHVNKSFNPNK